MLNRKLAQALLKLAGIDPNTPCGSLTGKQLEKIRKELKECAIDIAKIDKKMLKLRKEIEKI